MYYTYYHEFKTKDGEIVYHKNCCKKRIRGKNPDRKDTPRMIKKKKERLILDLKKKLLTAVNSFSLLDLEVINKIAERDPVLIMKIVATYYDSTDSGDGGSTDSTDSGGCDNANNGICTVKGTYSPKMPESVPESPDNSTEDSTDSTEDSTRRGYDIRSRL
jgi:hypothetical protein